MDSTIFHHIQIHSGTPYPLGANVLPDHTVNFAVASQLAESVTLCLFTDPFVPDRETHRIQLHGPRHDIWYVRVEGIPEGSRYGYRVNGEWAPDRGLFFHPCKLLVDPYAKRFTGPTRFHPAMVSLSDCGGLWSKDSAGVAPLALVPGPESYDWEGDERLRLPMTDSVFYEVHVKGFSQTNPAIPEEWRGTYAGLAHESSIQYWKDLGVTTLQLLPVHQHMDDGFLLEKGLVNYWGYNTVGFFAPEIQYAATGDPVTEFKDMVKALHRAGLEVILDVVYNHTCEGGTNGPTCFLRGFDNTVYYYKVDTDHGVYRDYTGVGNSVDVSHPQALRMVMDSLRYWVEEMHVDGFRFDLAVELGRMGDSYNRRSAFFQAIYQDPVLSQVKLIAEPWDLGPSGYQIGNFPNLWSELNGKFRDAVRAFWRGLPGSSREFAARITGSEVLFSHNRRTTEASLNMVTSHDGFTLRDLVSYNEKHNWANGEENRDGDSHNQSYNHGVEGDTDDPGIQTIRLRQIRNFLTTVICSQGVPFLLGGDERLRTQRGNNNAYCQDNEISWFDWEENDEIREMRAFTRRLLALRREHAVLRKREFFNGEYREGDALPDASWFRPDGRIKEWTDWEENKPGNFTLIVQSDPSLLFFFHAREEGADYTFPLVTESSWELLLDTADPARETVTAGSGATVFVTDRSVQIWKTTGTLFKPRE